MLFGGGGAPEPAVVGNVDEQLGAVRGKAADFSGVDCFVTDEGAVSEAAGQFSDGVVGTFAEATDFAGDAGDDAMDQRERLVFAEWNEMDFVVGEDGAAVVI